MQVLISLFTWNWLAVMLRVFCGRDICWGCDIWLEWAAGNDIGRQPEAKKKKLKKKESGWHRQKWRQNMLIIEMMLPVTWRCKLQVTEVVWTFYRFGEPACTGFFLCYKPIIMLVWMLWTPLYWSTLHCKPAVSNRFGFWTLKTKQCLTETSSSQGCGYACELWAVQDWSSILTVTHLPTF